MSNELWAEAISCAVYLQNRCPTYGLEDVTPQEAWTGRTPSVSHLKIFESIVYAHVPDQKRSKLEDKSKKLIFIGYDSSSKTYRLFDSNTLKVYVSRDVKFDEDGMWEKNLKEEANIRGDSDQTELKDQPSPFSLTSSSSSSTPSPSNSVDEPLVPRSRRLSEIY